MAASEPNNTLVRLQLGAPASSPDDVRHQAQSSPMPRPSSSPLLAITFRFSLSFPRCGPFAPAPLSGGVL
jgi:hypothetical protein